IDDTQRQIDGARKVGAGKLLFEIAVDISAKPGEILVGEHVAPRGRRGGELPHGFDVSTKREELKLERLQALPPPPPLSHVARQKPDRVVADVVATAAASQMLDAAVVQHAPKIARITERDETVAHINGAHAHIADTRMKSGGVAEKYQRLFAVVLEFGAAVDIAQQQTNYVGRIREFERIRFGAGNAITDALRLTTKMELFKAAK